LAVREVSDVNVGAGFTVIVCFHPDVSKPALCQGFIESTARLVLFRFIIQFAGDRALFLGLFWLKIIGV
jgi:hypothetical protein